MHRLLDSILAMLALLYNAALEERILAHRMPGKSISLYDHYKLLPTIRREAAERRDIPVLPISAQSPFWGHALRRPVWTGR